MNFRGFHFIDCTSYQMFCSYICISSFSHIHQWRNRLTRLYCCRKSGHNISSRHEIYKLTYRRHVSTWQKEMRTCLSTPSCPLKKFQRVADTQHSSLSCNASNGNSVTCHFWKRVSMMKSLLAKKLWSTHVSYPSMIPYQVPVSHNTSGQVWKYTILSTCYIQKEVLKICQRRPVMVLLPTG